jgi:hypothetical protein
MRTNSYHHCDSRGKGCRRNRRRKSTAAADCGCGRLGRGVKLFRERFFVRLAEASTDAFAYTGLSHIAKDCPGIVDLVRERDAENVAVGRVRSRQEAAAPQRAGDRARQQAGPYRLERSRPWPELRGEED